jgi:hypothetical protein
MRKGINESTQKINALMTSAKLRAIAGKEQRHTILRHIRNEQVEESDKRQSAADTFYNFCRDVIPKVEDRIEAQLLDRYKETLATYEEK